MKRVSGPGSRCSGLKVGIAQTLGLLQPRQILLLHGLWAGAFLRRVQEVDLAFISVRNNWTDASRKLKSRRFLGGELSLTQFCRTWSKRKLVVSPGLAELITWQGCVSIPGSESGQRSLTQRDQLHFEGMLCRTQHSSMFSSPVTIPLLQGSLSRDAALIEAVWESGVPSDGAMPNWNYHPWHWLGLSSSCTAFDLLPDKQLFLISLNQKPVG